LTGSAATDISKLLEIEQTLTADYTIFPAIENTKLKINEYKLCCTFVSFFEMTSAESLKRTFATMPENKALRC
jgi:hypothetical protein